MILLGFVLLIWAYVDCYQLNLAALAEPGPCIADFSYDLTWTEQYAWARILCPILAFGGIILQMVLRKKGEESADA